MVIDVVHVQVGRAERDEECRVPDDLELRDRVDPAADRCSRLENLLSDLEVAALAQAHHGGPGRGHDSTRAAAGQPRREVDSTRPIREVEVLVPA